MKPTLPLLAAAAALLATPIAHADPQAVALLLKVAAATQAAQSMTADLTYSVQYPGQAAIPAKATVKLMKPNYAAVTFPAATGSAYPNVVDSDGASTWTFAPHLASYRKTATQADGANIRFADSIVVQAFFDAPGAVKDWIYVQDLNDLTYAGMETVGGTQYRVLKHEMTGTLRGQACPFVQRLYVGPDNLIHRYRLDFKFGGKPGVQVADLTNVRLNAPLAASDFAFTPPADAPVLTQDAPVAAAKVEAAKTPAPPVLLAEGATAPDFTVQDRDGKPVKLSDFAGKVVVLDFWATWCPPCRASMPHTNEIAQRYKDKGVVVLAVNTSDTKDAFLKWLPDHTDLSGMTFVIDTADRRSNIARTLYGVTGIPTQFVIDKTGKVTKAFVGYGGPTPDLENAIVAAKG